MAGSTLCCCSASLKLMAKEGKWIAAIASPHSDWGWNERLFDVMVGAEGFEPPTLCSQSRCATRLRYAPNSSFDCNPDRFRSTRFARRLDPLLSRRIWTFPRQIYPLSAHPHRCYNR